LGIVPGRDERLKTKDLNDKDNTISNFLIKTPLSRRMLQEKEWYSSPTTSISIKRYPRINAIKEQIGNL
jgi:hypothetical protein